MSLHKPPKSAERVFYMSVGGFCATIHVMKRDILGSGVDGEMVGAWYIYVYICLRERVLFSWFAIWISDRPKRCMGVIGGLIGGTRVEL